MTPSQIMDLIVKRRDAALRRQAFEASEMDRISTLYQCETQVVQELNALIQQIVDADDPEERPSED